MLFEYRTEDYRYLNALPARRYQVCPKKGIPLTVKHSPVTWLQYRKSRKVWGAYYPQEKCRPSLAIKYDDLGSGRDIRGFGRRLSVICQIYPTKELKAL